MDNHTDILPDQEASPSST